MPRRSTVASPPVAPLPPPPAASGAGPPPRWRKVLYERQPYDDAHTGDSFLEELVVNATVPHRDYKTVVWSALVVDQQLATVAAVGSASHHLYQGTISPRHLLLADVLLMLLGALLYAAASAWSAARAPAGRTGSGGTAPTPCSSPVRSRDAAAAAGKPPSCSVTAASPSEPLQDLPVAPAGSRQHRGSRPPWPSWPTPSWRVGLDGAASMASLAAATALLSPLLGTLTETVSSDSIVACACCLKLLHLSLHDYHFAVGLTAHVSGSLALGAAVCGSVLIASRLPCPEAVYAQLLLSLELYILGPYCRRKVAGTLPAGHAVLTLGMVSATTLLLVRQSILLTSSFLCALIFVTFICPMWLVRIHKFKAAINGPWDEAVPRLSRAVTWQLAQHES